MERNELNASSFAEQIGVGRSSISHILSGRNKPSLDFVLSVLKQFPEVDLYWLLNGKGSYPKSTNAPTKPLSTPATSNPGQQVATDTAPPISKTQDLFSEKEAPESLTKDNRVVLNNGKNVLKVILLYEDGTFDSFDQK